MRRAGVGRPGGGQNVQHRLGPSIERERAARARSRMVSAHQPRQFALEQYVDPKSDRQERRDHRERGPARYRRFSGGPTATRAEAGLERAVGRPWRGNGAARLCGRPVAFLRLRQEADLSSATVALMAHQAGLKPADRQ